MDRFPLAAALTVLLVAGCAVAFKDRRTPSGDFCSDMPVVPAGQDVDREYHRLQPISSDQKARTEAERLESLRKAACIVGADAVIEAVNEEVRADNATYITVSSGTAIIWLRRTAESVPTPLKITPHKKPGPEASAEPAPSEEPPAAPAKSATPGVKPALSANPKAPKNPPAKAADPTKKKAPAAAPDPATAPGQ